MMVRFVYATLLGLVGAAVVHVVIILLLPLLANGTAWNTVSSLSADSGGPVALEAKAQPRLASSLDPLFRTFGCTFDLADGAFRVTSDVRVPLWTVGVHDTSATAFFSANDRIAAGRRLDIAVVNEFQLRIIRQNPPAELANTIIAPSLEQQGFVVVRVFAPDDTWEPVVESFARSLACSPLEL